MKLAARLIDLARFEDADTVLENALAAWPGRPRLLHLHAMSAHSSGRFQVAFARWERLRIADPSNVWAWCGIAATARMIGDLKSAEATIREAIAHFPLDPGVASEAARVFGEIGVYAEAANQWRRLLDLGQMHQDCYQGYVLSLVRTRQFEEAETILDQADLLFPKDRGLLTVRAMLAMEREDWITALSCWQTYRQRHPEDQAGWDWEGATRSAIATAQLEASRSTIEVTRVDIDPIEDASVRMLMLGFESIGADCEFGLVQRRFGAEPLGLLRFNDVALPGLIAALAASFEGMGEPANTSLTTSQSGEFHLSDRRWGLGMHTFLYSSGHDSADVKAKMCRRVVYLRDKLRADLRGAEKVFVYKSDAIDLDELFALHSALHAHGPNRLLHVRSVRVPLADWPLAAAGQVFALSDDLFVGYLGRLGNAGPEWNIAFDQWVSICAGLSDAPLLSSLHS